MPNRPFPRVRAAAFDGRLANTFFRQQQLQNLHEALLTSADGLQAAIQKDSVSTASDATIEYCLAVEAVKKRYNELDPSHDLDEEYRIAKGKDAGDRREGVGIAYIVPGSHSPLYSVIVPLAAAIAAGNCVILELPKTLRALPSLIHTILKTSLEPDIFDISDKRPTDVDFLQECVLVLQKEEPITQHYPHLLYSRSNSPVVAIVDRTADVQQAAKALVAARFSFTGQSPYAPDLVLVNEFIKKPFLNAVVQESIGYLVGSAGSATTNGIPVKSGEKAPVSLVEEVKGQKGVTVVTSGSLGAILDFNDRNSLASKKINEKVLCIHAVTSIDDAIDFINSTSNTLLASYIFGSPAAAKYLGQFIRNEVSFVNYVPGELLIGPAAPSGRPVDPSERYPSDFFSVPRPSYIQSSSKNTPLSSVMLGEKLEKNIAFIKQDALKELKVVKRAETYGIGYFEQGILTGLGMVGVPILAMLTTGAVYSVRYAIKTWQARHH